MYLSLFGYLIKKRKTFEQEVTWQMKHIDKLVNVGQLASTLTIVEFIYLTKKKELLGS